MRVRRRAQRRPRRGRPVRSRRRRRGGLGRTRPPRVDEAIGKKAKAPPSAVNWRQPTYSDAPRGRRRGRRTTRGRGIWNPPSRVGERRRPARDRRGGSAETQGAPGALLEQAERAADAEGGGGPERAGGRNPSSWSRRRRGACEGGATVSARGRGRRCGPCRGRGRGGGVERTLRGSRGGRSGGPRGEQGEAQGVRGRGRREEKFAEEAAETTASFSGGTKRAGMSDGFRTKRNAYLESIKPPPESVGAKGGGAKPGRRRGAPNEARRSENAREPFYSCHSRKRRTGRIDESSHHRRARRRRRRGRNPSVAVDLASIDECVIRRPWTRTRLPPPHTLRTRRRPAPPPRRVTRVARRRRSRAPGRRSAGAALGAAPRSRAERRSPRNPRRRFRALQRRRRRGDWNLVQEESARRRWTAGSPRACSARRTRCTRSARTSARTSPCSRRWRTSSSHHADAPAA